MSWNNAVETLHQIKEDKTAATDAERWAQPPVKAVSVLCNDTSLHVKAYHAENCEAQCEVLLKWRYSSVIRECMFKHTELNQSVLSVSEVSEVTYIRRLNLMLI